MIISPYSVMRITDRRALEAERRAQIRCLMQEAMAEERAWMPRRITLLLSRVGRLLVVSGRRLQHIGTLQGAPMGGRVTTQGPSHILSRHRQ